jgi:transaldolase
MDDFELIIDTADIDSIRRCDEILDVQGVTTNPTIITKTGKPAEQAIADLVEYLRPDQKLFVQVVATDLDGIMSEARHIAGLRPENTYAKIPVTHPSLAFDTMIL